MTKIAAVAGSKKFISTSGCIQATDGAWFDKLLVFSVEDRLLIIGYVISLILFGLTAPLFVKFRQRKVIREKPAIFTKS